VDFNPEEIDLTALTLAEIEEMEERCGMGFAKIGKALEGDTSVDVPIGRLMRSLAFVLKKREDPEFTWEQAGALNVQLVDEAGKVPVPPA
jgi:hypothetical protein